MWGWGSDRVPGPCRPVCVGGRARWSPAVAWSPRPRAGRTGPPAWTPHSGRALGSWRWTVSGPWCSSSPASGPGNSSRGRTRSGSRRWGREAGGRGCRGRRASGTPSSSRRRCPWRSRRKCCAGWRWGSPRSSYCSSSPSAASPSAAPQRRDCDGERPWVSSDWCPPSSSPPANSPGPSWTAATARNVLPQRSVSSSSLAGRLSARLWPPPAGWSRGTPRLTSSGGRQQHSPPPSSGLRTCRTARCDRDLSRSERSPAVWSGQFCWSWGNRLRSWCPGTSRSSPDSPREDSPAWDY